MRKCFFLVFLNCSITFLNAQDIVIKNLSTETSKTVTKEADTSKWNWKHGGLINFTLNQGSLSNWASGGDNFSMAISSYFHFFYLYQKNRDCWDNSLDMNLGFVQTSSLGSRKNDDRFDYLSKYDYKMDTLGKWYLSSLFNFRSQFFDGYTYNNNAGTFASSFLAPAYVLLSVGFDYKPQRRLSIFMSPLTSRWVIVANNVLAKQAAYGVDTGKSFKNEIGGFATINYSSTLDKNINYKGRLDLFSNYTHNPQNVDVYMTNQLSFKINKYFSATYSLDLIYDDDVRIFGPQGKSPGLQTKSILGIGFLKVLNTKKRLINGDKIRVLS
ncbi:DUF3078 domain-containing protein [Parasediminibacterium sp. JCM 36343]|uniref:DUF3078 domain-containing protein n=1 Tax=Parasediminibacterium sp. JCM 36343 TaxID=3374279 RepID=UPI0039793C08